MADITKSLQKVTPFIKPIATSGGTLYTFSSAAEDLTLSFNTDTSRKFRFSKFALLNIPDVLSSNPVENTVRLQAIPGGFQYVDRNITTKLNHFFSESFQNYCLNLETTILSDDNYNPNNFLTVSERVFFKWLKELSAIRFKSDPKINARYTEEEDSSNQYNRVVQYVGEIDFVNNLSTQVNSYSEVYIHVPTEVGNFENVYFKTVSDDNYGHSMSFTRAQDGINNEIICGRNYSDFNPSGLNIKAYFDNDIGLPQSTEYIEGRLLTQWKRKLSSTNYLINSDNYDINRWWYYPTTDTNVYYLEPGTFTDATNDDLAISVSDDPNEISAVQFRRSRLDGISLDFDYNTYKNSTNYITSLIDVAKSSGSKDFEFNAILIYYDLYEDVVSTASDTLIQGTYPDYDPEAITNQTLSTDSNVLATNLFGVLFLSDVKDNLSITGGYIPRFKKVRPNSVAGLNGNAYGIKLNMKLDVSPVNTGVNIETVISDSNTLSMDIYADALNAIRNSSEHLENVVFNSLVFDGRVNSIESAIKNYNTDVADSLVSRVKLVEEYITTQNSSTEVNVLALIDNLTEKLNSILTNNTHIDVKYDLGVFVPGNGINLTLNDNTSKLLISSTSDNFMFQNKKEVSVYKDWDAVPQYLKGTNISYTYECDLKPLKNYLRINDDSTFMPNKDMTLFIKDDVVSWQPGQVFRIYFENPIKMSNQLGDFDFYIYTDYKNKLKKSSNYSALVCKVSSQIFQNKNMRPVIEIICSEPDVFEFFIDYLN